jgi:hypothetical protein
MEYGVIHDVRSQHIGMKSTTLSIYQQGSLGNQVCIHMLYQIHQSSVHPIERVMSIMS